MLPICFTHGLALLSHYFKSSTCVCSVIFSLQRPASKRTGLAVQVGAKAAAKPAPCAIASSSSASATHPVPVMQTEHVQVQSVLFLYPEVVYRSFGSSITVVLHETHWHCINAKVFSLLASVEGTTVCLKYPCNLPPPPCLGDRHLATVSPPPPGDRHALTREFARGGGQGNCDAEHCCTCIPGRMCSMCRAL